MTRLRTLLIGLAVAVGVLWGAPATFAGVIVNGCDAIATNPAATSADVHRLDDNDDGWETLEVINGVLDMTLDTGGFQYAPGVYRIYWDDGTQEDFTLICVPPPINENQDPADTDLCTDPEPGVVIEGCDTQVSTTGVITEATSSTDVPSSRWLPETSTAPAEGQTSLVGRGFLLGSIFGAIAVAAAWALTARARRP